MAIKVKNLKFKPVDTPPWLMPLEKCKCGYGEGFYCRGYKDSRHEYNPHICEEKATALKGSDRAPVAVIFSHIDGRRVVVRTGGKEHSFTYKKYGDSSNAFNAAIQSCKPESDLFS